MCRSGRSADSQCMKWYSLYSAAKLITVASILLAVAVGRRRTIDGHYDGDPICSTCLQSSKLDQAHLYEFDPCRYRWGFRETSDNLLRSGGFWDIGVGSALYSYVPSAALIFVLIVLLSVILPCTSWNVFGINFDYDPIHGGFGTEATDDDARDRDPLIARSNRSNNNNNRSAAQGSPSASAGGIDSKQSNENNNNNNNNNAQLGDAQLAYDIERGGGDPVRAGVVGAPPLRPAGTNSSGINPRQMHTPSDRLSYGFGYVSHNDQCVFLHYQVGLLCGLLILVLSNLLSELYLIPAKSSPSNTCYVSAYTRDMDLCFTVFVVIALIFLLVEACINFCFPQRRFIFNVLTGIAMLLIIVLALVMGIRNVAGPAGDVLTFMMTLIGVAHIIEVPIVLLRHVSHQPATHFMHA